VLQNNVGQWQVKIEELVDRVELAHCSERARAKFDINGDAEVGFASQNSTAAAYFGGDSQYWQQVDSASISWLAAQVFTLQALDKALIASRDEVCDDGAGSTAARNRYRYQFLLPYLPTATAQLDGFPFTNTVFCKAVCGDLSQQRSLLFATTRLPTGRSSIRGIAQGIAEDGLSDGIENAVDRCVC